MGGLLGMILMPVILVLFVGMLLLYTFGSSLSIFTNGGIISYDENAFQDYADAQYAAEFGSSTAYEDNLLIVFLVDEDYYDYHYIAWVGDHIATDISYMFGNNETELGRAIAASVNSNSYKYSLDSNLAQAMESMENQIVSLGLSDSYKCEENHIQTSSHLTNKTDLELTAETVNMALESFTEKTGIPVVLVVEDVEDVFGKQMPASTILVVVIAIALLILAVCLLIRAWKKRNQSGGNSGYQSYTGS